MAVILPPGIQNGAAGWVRTVDLWILSPTPLPLHHAGFTLPHEKDAALVTLT